jgi:cobalt-zinc-cadmium efflux system outer membrane protein
MRLGFVLLLIASTTAAQPAPLTTPLTYQQALDLATSRNLGVAAARRARAIREAAVRTARQYPNPDLSVELTQDLPHQIVTAGIPLDFGPRRSRRIELANEELSLAEVDVQSELRTVRRAVRQAYYSLLAGDERLSLAESILELSQRFRDAAQARFEAGAAPRLEVLQADLGVARARADVELARSDRVAAQATLNSVINAPAAQPVALAGTMLDGVPAIAYEPMLALAVASNVDLIALDRQISIEQRRVGLLRAERTPAASVSFSALFNAQPDFTSGAGVGVGLSLPLFSRNQGEIAQSIAAVSQLHARREATMRELENSVFGLTARISAQRRRTETYDRELVPTASSLESLAEESYRAGRTSVLGVLDAQRNLRDLRREALQAALDLQLTIADLEEQLGTDIR